MQFGLKVIRKQSQITKLQRQPKADNKIDFTTKPTIFFYVFQEEIEDC